MYKTVAEHVADYREDMTEAAKLFDALTDESLKREVAPGYWTLDQLAWHMITARAGLLKRLDVSIDYELPKDPPASAAEIARHYREGGEAVLAAVEAQLKDERLTEPVDFYGMAWDGSKLLWEMLKHETHHRGQMTVLMRQAGLAVHGVFGPSKEEREKMGIPE